MNFPRALRIIVALALLSAQQAALSHQLWHLLDRGTGSTQGQLCDQHEALGTVAGALDAPVLLAAGQLPAVFSHCFVALPAAATPGLAPSSRGPPALL